MTFFDKVIENISANNLLENKDSVLVALSGGPDSVVLLHILSKMAKNYKLKLYSIYINHQIRPKAAKIELAFCRNLSKKLGVSFVSVKEDIPKLAKQLRIGIEEAARNYRYEQFESTADELNCRKIALGHHIDDRVETVLFRIFRGTGITGLKGIPVKRDKYIRPLFDVTKAEILDYLKKNKLKYCIDQSNLRTDYTRNYIRNRLLPQIRKRINNNVDRAILNLIDSLTPEDQFLESIIDKEFARSVTLSASGKLILALKEFNNYDLWLQRRLIRRCIVKLSGTSQFPDKETVERILELAKGKEKAVSIPEKIQCTRKENEIFFITKRNPKFDRQLREIGVTKISNFGFFTVKESSGKLENGIDRQRNSTKVIVDLDKLSRPLLVRNIVKGDRFRPLGLGGSKKIGDYLTDRKVNVLTRDEIPVVADQKGIFWLVGFEIDERVKIDKNTKRALKIEFRAVDKA